MDDRGFILDGDACAQDVYSKLNVEEVRTLLLAPGKRGTPIVCEMQVIASPKCTQYEALSYVWGDTTKTKTISCNGFDFPVTESLYTALVHLRYTNSWRCLWVDQLCINQVEDHELMAQVGLMGTIYSHACRVIVWLGKYDQKMALAWELLQETTLSSSLVRSDFLQTSTGPVTPQKRSSTPRRASRSSSISKYSRRASSSRESLSSSTSSLKSITPTRPKNKRQDTPPALKHALSIFQHAWFSRKWTFQEIILAKAAIICCGNREMAWSDLTLWYFHYASKLRSSSLLYDSHGSFENIMNVRNELGKGSLKLSNLLMLTRPRMSTKPEDAVYALLGLLPDLAETLKTLSNPAGAANATAAQCDALFNLYLAAVKYCLERENDLAILSAAGKYKGNLQAADWPSWLPDWRQQLPLRPIVLVNPTDLGPEPAFDEEMSESTSPATEVVAKDQNIYKLNVSPLHGFPRPTAYSMTVWGVRLGCIVTRPLSWPSTFFVADTIARSCLGGRNSNGDASSSDGSFSQPLASLVSSHQSLSPQTQKATHSKINQGYAANLIQRSLKNSAQCPSVRTSAMIETGDWLCAFHGGRVLYAVRPIQELPRPYSGAGRRRLHDSSSQARPIFSNGQESESIRCVFLGECAVYGLNPAQATGGLNKMDEFELV
ncbi:uncharacterized protein Z518_05394 [Rhinocladiella mackenziei CBS 650.93]|uniref:Rhinocladiella mackenziei CBS 650.93 unplaced genomic scaffold supercont1.4, whole genome shotgun sequence n=1 Tax=Rhinocladiella mackenziei CBS 650.93 TaxID=1442369 RepID=A0A0D2IFF3_9EURO|nr:uncharacterized protein Z518_05394 [Rhinocladiella mackenziei CBS 650.93]KIX04524.1 hypothetical protein Z518_05394 [Rhinocladiella mackenziei CBS 650.93]